MFAEHPEVESRVYVHLSSGTPVKVVRHRDDEEEDIFSVRFGDENLVLEFDQGLLPRLIQVLELNAG